MKSVYIFSHTHFVNKNHIQVKFTSPYEHRIICVSVLLNKYRELIHKQDRGMFCIS